VGRLLELSCSSGHDFPHQPAHLYFLFKIFILNKVYIEGFETSSACASFKRRGECRCAATSAWRYSSVVEQSAAVR
jgi:hypothetical protein